jgi:LDH2 family malate/lactate/ureidoglycolate dehydrogenase
MQTDEPGRARIGAADALALAERALMGAGCEPQEAAILAAHMLDAALCGYEYSGLPKILNVAEYRLQRSPTGPMKLRHDTPMSTLYDGQGNNGMFTVFRAAEIAIVKARASGFAMVGVNNTWMSGRGAYFVEMLARTGLIGILAISSRHQVAPPGAARAAIGTNPISFGFPTEDDPLLIDIGTSALMFTDLALRARRNQLLPPGTAIDAAGRPTQDPLEALQGAVLSFGGYKGFALALAMKALGVLAGSGSDRDRSAGYLLLAFQPEMMMPLSQYRSDLSQALAHLRSTPRQEGVEAIRIPSDRSYAQRRLNLEQGIVIDQHVYEELLRLAAQRDFSMP